MILQAPIRDRLRRYVRRLAKDDELASFIRVIKKNGEPFIFGGAARDVAFGVGRLVHDLDIFVSGRVDVEEVSQVASNFRKTNFGGLRMNVGRYEVDAWELQKSYAFRLDAPSYISIENLLRSVCFSTDGIAVSLESGRALASRQFCESLEARRLDFVVPPFNFEPVVATRIARLVLKLDLEMTPSVAGYFVRCVEDFGVGNLIESEARWGNHRMLNEIAVEQVRTEIKMAIFRASEVIRAGSGEGKRGAEELSAPRKKGPEWTGPHSTDR